MAWWISHRHLTPGSTLSGSRNFFFSFFNLTTGMSLFSQINSCQKKKQKKKKKKKKKKKTNKQAKQKKNKQNKRGGGSACRLG